MHDLLFGAADNYTWDQIRPWARSIRDSGFTGEVVLLVYRGDVEGIAEKCAELDITVLHSEANSWGEHIEHATRGRDTQSHQMRFFHLYQYLEPSVVKNLRYVITTDTRDVVFQRNPSDFLEQTLTKGMSHILAPSEGIRYCDEPWGRDNVAQGFGPIVVQRSEGFEIFNVGTIAGRAGAIRDLALTLYSMGEGRFIPNDQSAFNLLVNGDLLNVERVRHDAGWACQCGTMADPGKMEGFRPHLLGPEPTFDEDGYALTSRGTKFYLLHQWDRVPGVAAKVVRRYYFE